ncbi:MAG TPA: lanthionine synthetase C family protein [Chthonomonadaceae bacterium]|nr:lanthionine synthetase C family protein [Chthonomonadaceae bacterium]
MMTQGNAKSNAVTVAWQPLLEGDLAACAKAILLEIAQELRDPPPAYSLPMEASLPDRQRLEEVSLAGGRTGLAVLFAYLAQAGFDGEAAETAARFLEDGIVALSTLPMPPNLYSGFTGIAWAVAHLQETEEDEEDAGEEIDAALLDYLGQSSWRSEYDLINGLVGIGVYAAERLPRPSAAACLEQVIARLEEAAERSDEGAAWFTPAQRLPGWQRKLCPAGYYNLGLAHGVPGVIGLLGIACHAGIARERAQPLLEVAVAWLLRQKLPPDSGGSFPSWVGPGIPLEASRSAWCYGDPGVAVTLLLAARGAGREDWEAEALEVACRAAQRPVSEAGVQDAGLCHGAAGLGHLFNRLYQATGEPRLGAAARYWLERALQMRQPGMAVAGYPAWLPGPDDALRWEADPGLLTGAAGVALALLAAITPIEPAWDRMLLLSGPKRVA